MQIKNLFDLHNDFGFDEAIILENTVQSENSAIIIKLFI